MDKKRLLQKALVRFLSGVAAIGLILFLAAGTFRWWNAWAFLAVLFLPMAAFGIHLLNREPELLAKRLDMKETEKKQKTMMTLAIPLFAAGYLLPGIDFRFGWSAVPLAVVIFSFVFVALGYGLFVYVLQTNAYASRTVAIQEHQKLIDFGPYRVVRHPMYTASVLIFVLSPLALGSWFGFAIMLFYPVLLKTRIQNEEDVLQAGLNGYAAYQKRVKWRLIPYIW